MSSQDIRIRTPKTVVLRHNHSNPIPSTLTLWLLKECVEELLPIITTFVNRSMQEGTVPKSEISKTCSCDAHSKERWHGSKYPQQF